VSDWTRDLIWNGIGYAIVAGLAVVTWLLLFVLKRPVRWLPLRHLRPVNWTGHEVFLAFCLLLGLPPLIVTSLFLLGFFTPLLGPAPDPQVNDQQFSVYSARGALIAYPLILTVTLGSLFAFLFARRRMRPHHYGLSWARWPANVSIGLAGFLLVTPVVLAIFAAASLIFWTRPHPVTMLGTLSTPDWEWLLIAFQTVVAAPLIEEIVFRGILLGWMRRASLFGHTAIMLASLFSAAVGIAYDDPSTGVIVYDASPLVLALVMVGGYAYWMVLLKRRFNLGEGEIKRWRPSSPPRWWDQANASLAIYGSAMFFALFHMNAWPGQIALFPMGLALAWIANRTQSLLGPIAFHAAFNLVAFIALYGSTLSAPDKNGNEHTTAVRPSVAGSTINSMPGSQLPRRK
jgi:membrane protease YdiL (CAAX protease family)